MDVKKKIIAELDDRIRRLDEHRSCCTEPTENQYDEAQSGALPRLARRSTMSWRSIRGFVESCNKRRGLSRMSAETPLF